MNNYDVNLTSLWNDGTEKDWNDCNEYLWNSIKPSRMSIVREIEELDTDRIALMSTREFYDFLHDSYFVWKYTAPNRLATTRKHLEKYKTNNQMDLLSGIHTQLFDFNKSNIREGLNIATKIYGLGTAGASGLLAILFSEYFATVDQFVVQSLQQIENLPQQHILKKMNPKSSISIKNGEVLIEIMRDKAVELNERFNTDTWTPKKIDMILWILR